MRRLFSGMIVGVSTLILVASVQAQTFSNYDLFTGPLDPTLWNGSEQNTNSAVVSNTETQRAVLRPDPLLPNRLLQLMLRTGHPGTSSDTGTAGEGRQRLVVARDDILGGSTTLIGMRTRIVVTAMATPGCPTSPDPVLLANQSRSRATMLGFFFNDGSGGSADATGDIIAGINIEQRSTDGKVIVAFVNRCDNATCSTSTTLKAVVFTRKWALNVPVPTIVAWDPANNQFSFSAGREIQALTYGDLGLSDALPPVFLIYDLRVSNVVANCSTAMRSGVTARFDFLQLAQ